MTDLTLRGSTPYGYLKTLERHIEPAFGERRIDHITTPELRTFLAELSLGAAGKAGVYRLLAKAFNQAVRDGVLARSPLAPIRKPAAPRSSKVPLAVEDVFRLADAARPRLRAAILTGALAGLRAGEIGGLRLEDVDAATGSIRVERAVRREGGQRVLGEVETPAGRRSVAVPTLLLRELEEHCRRFAPSSDGS